MSTTITPVPDFELITLAEAKKQLRLDASFTDEDSIITGNILTALSAAEAYLNRGAGALCAADIEVTATGFAGTGFAFWGDTKVNEVSVLLVGELERTVLPASSYMVWRGNSCSQIRLTVNPDSVPLQEVSNAVIVKVSATVPFAIKQACLLMLADYYEYREDRNDTINSKAQNLMRAWRNY